MYYYMSLCNILFLTSIESLDGFASNFVWMFLRWTPSNFVRIRVLPLCYGIMGNFVQFLANA